MPLLPDLVKPLEVAASLAKMITTLASVSPDGGEGRASRDHRARIYGEFQRAAQDVIGCATHLRVLAASNSPSRDRFLRTALSMADAVPFDLAGLQGLTRLLHAASPVLRLAVAGDLVGDAQHRHATYRAVERMRGAVAVLVTALGEVRLNGRPGPQEQAENITALIGELLGRIAREDKGFEDCQLALGVKARDFVIAVRVDLDQRWWHIRKRPRSRRWQIWRPLAMPSLKWKSPDPIAMIAEAGQHSLSTPQR